MPLESNALSALIIQEFGKLNSGNAEVDASYDEGTKKIADAIANAVVQHIKANAEVIITSGATTCSAGVGTITTGIGKIQ